MDLSNKHKVTLESISNHTIWRTKWIMICTSSKSITNYKHFVKMGLSDRNNYFIKATHKDFIGLDHPFKTRITGFNSKKLPLMLIDALNLNCTYLNHHYLTLHTACPIFPGARELLWWTWQPLMLLPFYFKRLWILYVVINLFKVYIKEAFTISFLFFRGSNVSTTSLVRGLALGFWLTQWYAKL